MPAIDCPDHDTLTQLLLGKLPEQDAETYESHLLHCENCSQIADTIEPADDITAALTGGDDAYPDNNELNDVIERAVQLRETSRITGRETPASAAVGDQNQASDLEIDFLAPPRGPGELGWMDEYRVLDVVGQGGMGVVLRAEDPQLQRIVALKTLKPAIAASQSARQRFLREARATAAIEHDNIVAIHHVGEQNSVPFIAMPFLEGESLADRLARETRLDQNDVLRIGREIADGLAAAHNCGLIHRDIKPENIWLDRHHGRVRILDFGLARGADDESGLTQSGLVLGTPRYMSPEQAQTQKVDHRSDLFSLGGVLYHVLTGKTPFVGDNVTAMLMAVTHHEPAPIETACPQVRPELSRLITQLLAKDPNQRPQSASDVSERLRDIEQTPEIDAGCRQAVAAPTHRSDQRTTNGGSARAALTAPFLRVIGGAAIVVLLSVIIIRITNRDGTKTEVLVDATEARKVVVDLSKAGVDKPAVEILPKSPPAGSPPPPPVNPPDERAVAQWVLDVGLDVHVSTDVDSPSKRVWDKLPAGDFQITAINLIEHEVTDNEIATLRGLPRLADLTIVGGKHFTDEGLKSVGSLNTLSKLSLKLTDECRVSSLAGLARLTKLKILYVESSHMTDAGLRPVAQMKSIDNLGLKTPEVTGAGLTVLSELSLRHLRLEDASRIDDAALAHLKMLPLKALDISGSRVTGTGLAELTGGSLSSLAVRNSPVHDRLMAGLHKFQLRNIQLDGTRVSDAGIRLLKEQTAIDFLSLADTRVSDDCIPTIITFKHLAYLILNHTRVTDSAIEQLGSMTSLIELQLTGTNISDASIEHLGRLTSLRSTRVDDTDVTPAGAQRLAQRLPRCRVLFTDDNGETKWISGSE